MAKPNSSKEKLKNGGRVFGTWTVTSSPMVASVLAHSGLDYVTIDMEHGPTTFQTAESILYAIEEGGATPMIRLAEKTEATILHALDIGAQGLLTSHVSSGEEAARIVGWCKYHPEGVRGLSPFIRTHGYSETDLPAKLKSANEELLTGVLIEDAEGFRNLGDIVATPHLDMVYVGVYDLSQTVGEPGNLGHPTVVEAVRNCVKVIEDGGLAAGAVARDAEHMKFLLDAGFRYISYLVDTAILREGFEAARRAYDDLVGQS